MSQQKFLRAITIKMPCSASWEEMRGNDQVRVCEHCDLSVHDLSRLTPAKALKLVQGSNGRLCLRIHRTPAGDVITRPVYQKFHTLTRVGSRIAAGAFTAVMGLSTAAHAQSGASGNALQNPPTAAATLNNRASGPSGWLIGRALDENEAVIPGATVTITNEQTGETQSLTTDAEGGFRVWLAGGFSYQTEISSPGFGITTTKSITLDISGETKLDVTLVVSSDNIMGGAIVAIPYTQPLVIAANEGDQETVRELLRRGENINEVEEFGMTALSVAVTRGDFEMVQLLLGAGASVGPTEPDGDNPLFFVYHDTDPRLVSLLVKYGANINHVNAQGNTPLIHLAEWNSKELTNAFLQAGADVNAQNKDGNTALMIAAQEGNTQTVEALLTGGAIHALRNAAGEDALTLARSNGQEDVVALLHAAGATDPGH